MPVLVITDNSTLRRWALIILIKDNENDGLGQKGLVFCFIFFICLPSAPHLVIANKQCSEALGCKKWQKIRSQRMQRQRMWNEYINQSRDARELLSWQHSPTRPLPSWALPSIELWGGSLRHGMYQRGLWLPQKQFLMAPCAEVSVVWACSQTHDCLQGLWPCIPGALSRCEVISQFGINVLLSSC